MKIGAFRIEQYYATHEFSTRYMLSSSDCESRSIAELLAFEPDAADRLGAQRLGYTESEGSLELRQAAAAIYDQVTADDVLVASCAEEGIFLVYHALVGPGDHVIVETPCYESALEVARSTGAEVSRWERRFADGWAHDLAGLERLVQPNTRMIYVNQPHNPTGTLMDGATFAAVVELARSRQMILFSDEVYRELEHDPASRLPAACDLYDRALSLGSISKSYGLPGLRLGWIATRDPALRTAVLDLKHYTTICAPAPSELLTALALRHREVLTTQNHALTLHNLALTDAFLARHSDAFQWVRPAAGPIGFPKAPGLGDVDAACEWLASRGVLLLPGSVYDEPDHVRLGFGRANLPEAIGLLDELLEELLGEGPGGLPGAAR